MLVAAVLSVLAMTRLETIGGENKRPAKRTTFKSQLPRPSDTSWAPGAKTYLPKGRVMLEALIHSPSWASIYAPFIATLHKRWQVGKRLWAALQLEVLLLLAIEHGNWTFGGKKGRGFRAFLTSDDGRLMRLILGLREARSRRVKGIVNSLHVPSTSTISRFREEDIATWEERAAVAKRLFEAERDRGLAMPEFQAAGFIRYMDSYDVFITGKPEGEDDDEEDPTRSGEPRNHRRVPGAGRVGFRRTDKPGGPGFKVNDIVNDFCLPEIVEISPIQAADKTVGLERLLPELDTVMAGQPKAVRVMSCDAAYWGEDMIHALMRRGFVPNVHINSHADKRKRTIKSVNKRNREETPLVGTHWHANGHFELFCNCGHGTTSARVRLGASGRVHISTLCFCDTCGNIVVTAGRWRLYQNPTEYRKLDGSPCPRDMLRPYLGNPLTYNDKRSERYGHDRFGRQEGFHSQLKGAYNIGGKDNPNPIESKEHLEYVVYIACAIMWANAIERVLEARERGEEAA